MWSTLPPSLVGGGLEQGNAEQRNHTATITTTTPAAAVSTAVNTAAPFTIATLLLHYTSDAVLTQTGDRCVFLSCFGSSLCAQDPAVFAAVRYWLSLSLLTFTSL